MKKILITTLFVVLFFIPEATFASVFINEIMYDLETGADGGREWIEIFNSGDSAVDLTGWKLREAETDHKLTIIQGTIVLPQNSYAIIADDSAKFLIDNPGFSGTIFDSTFSLNNDGENLILKDNNLAVIDEVLYNSSWGASGNGRSLQKDGTTWSNGIPTPGQLNNITPEPIASSSLEETAASASDEASASQATPTALSVNQPPIADAGDNIIGFTNQEIKFDGSNSSDPENNDLHYEWNMGNGKLIENPSFTYTYAYPGTYLITLMVFDGKNYSSDTITVKIQSAQIIINEFMANPEGKDEEEEWIEIYNDADSITDISSWQLDDIVSGSKPFTFPQNTLIAPKNYLVFSRQVTKIALNNDIDSVRLLLPDGTVFQEINYEKPPQGKSSARTNEGFVWSEPTPGMANIIGLSINGDKQTVSQISSVKPDVVKESSKGAIINLTESDIQGGYTNIGANDSKLSINTPDSSAGKFAGIKQSFQSPLNLALLIITIVFASGFVGLLLVKFRKRGLAP